MIDTSLLAHEIQKDLAIDSDHSINDLIPGTKFQFKILKINLKKNMFWLLIYHII